MVHMTSYIVSYLSVDCKSEFRCLSRRLGGAVKDEQSVPVTAPENCGHTLMHDRGTAKRYAARFAD